MIRNIDLGVLVSQEEEKKILEKAKKLGLNKSNFVRMILLNAEVSIK